MIPKACVRCEGRWRAACGPRRQRGARRAGRSPRCRSPAWREARRGRGRCPNGLSRRGPACSLRDRPGVFGACPPPFVPFFIFPICSGVSCFCTRESKGGCKAVPKRLGEADLPSLGSREFGRIARLRSLKPSWKRLRQAAGKPLLYEPAELAKLSFGHRPNALVGRFGAPGGARFEKKSALVF